MLLKSAKNTTKNKKANSDAGTENPRIYLRPILIPVVTGKIFAILLTLSI